MLRVFLPLLCLASAIHARNLCDLKEDDGLLCECRDTEALCEATRPLEYFVPAPHKLPYEVGKRRRDARNINTLSLIQTNWNESFVQKFPQGLLQEPLHLKIIHIAHAKFSALAPYSVHDSDYLKELSLSFCGITELKKKAIVGLKNLLKLDLSNNDVPVFDIGVLSDLPQLKELIVASSELSSIQPHAFVELKSLKNLVLKGNKIPYIDNQLFTGLRHLESIDMSYNQIEKIEDRTFEDVPRLTHVDLTGNSLLTITAKTFRGMHYLESLNLHYNTLKSLPDEFLKDSKNLKELNLSRNLLRTVTLDMLHGLRVIRRDFVLDIRMNPLNCSCDLHFLTELRKRRLAVMENGVTDPPEFEHLQCRVPTSDGFAPRILDNEVFLENACQENIGLAQHIAPLSIESSASGPLRPALIIILASLILLRLV